MVYDGYAPCSGTGLQWGREGLDASLEGGVAPILFDDECWAVIASIFADVFGTGGGGH